MDSLQITSVYNFNNTVLLKSELPVVSCSPRNENHVMRYVILVAHYENCIARESLKR